jgi:tetratricopeptide (TPR) repeat protein
VSSGLDARAELKTEDEGTAEAEHPTSGEGPASGEPIVGEDTGIYEITEEGAEITLDGRAASRSERERARKLIALFAWVAPRLDGAASARALHEVAELHAELRDEAASLRAHRAAVEREPGALELLRGWRKAAVRACHWQDVVTALELEARAASAPSYRAALHVERGQILDARLQNPTAARSAYEAALEDDRDHVTALIAMERLSLGDGAAAARWAQRLAEVATDPVLRSEHRARAARHYEAAADHAAASAQAALARVDGGDLPPVGFVLERLSAESGAYADLVALRREQADGGVFEADLAHFDRGVIARYHLEDRELAIQCFGAAAASKSTALASDALAELAGLLTKAERWAELARVEERRIEIEPDPTARAALWHSIASLRERRLDDVEGAIAAYESALREDAAFWPALEGAGRLYHRLGARDRLLEMHELEARQAKTAADRATALLRVGEMLIADSAALDEGIARLRAALAEAPEQLSVIGVLEHALMRKRDDAGLCELYQLELQSCNEPSRQAWLLTQIGMLAADRLDDRALAVAVLEDAIDLPWTGPPPSLVRLAQLLEEDDAQDKLPAVLERLLEQTTDPGAKATCLERLARAHERKGRIEEMLAAYERAVALAPPSHPVCAAAGRAFLRAGRHEALLGVLVAGTRAGAPGERSLWLHRTANVLDRDLGRTGDAIGALRDAIALAPDAKAARAALEALLSREERWSELFGLLESAEPDARTLLRRAMLAEALGELPLAGELYQKALETGCRHALLPFLRLAPHHRKWREVVREYVRVQGPPTMVLHARYRAAEVATVFLSEPLEGVRHLVAASAAQRDAVSPWLALLPLVDDMLDMRVRMLELIRTRTSDRATSVDLLMRRATTLDQLGLDDQALAARRELLELQPLHPIMTVAVELALERRGDRQTLAELYRNIADQPKLDPRLVASTKAALGRLLEELGQNQDAIEAFESSRAGDGARSLGTLLSLHRLYLVQGDAGRVLETAKQLAEALPAGPERAKCWRHVAVLERLLEHRQGAFEALQNALLAHPRDYDSLRELDELLTATGERALLIDPLSRAFQAETDPARSAALGCTLSVLLLREGRIEPAREAVDRILAVDSRCQPALLLRAEIQERRGAWEQAVETLGRLAGSDEVRREALRRMARIQAVELRDLDAARATAAWLRAVPQHDADALRIRLEIDQLVGQHQEAALTLAALADRSDVPESHRTAYLLALAALQERELDDPAAAIATLGRVGAEQREHAVTRLLALGQQTGRWDLAATGLEAALDRGGAMPPQWEKAVRRRLADLLFGPLGRKDAALRHYERIVELDPSDRATLELLAAAQAPTAPEKAVAYHRSLLQFDPARISSYRALRRLFGALGNEDGAFCAEAILVGLGVADEEEDYFYRQRRARIAGQWRDALEPSELDALRGPSEGVALGEALERALATVFPVDLASHGLDRQERRSDVLDPLCRELAGVLGVARQRVCAVPPAVGPAVELGDPPLLLLPRSLEDALIREQQFVCGALVGRILAHGIATDPLRLNAISMRQLQLLLDAARELAGTGEPRSRGEAMYEDIKRRLGGAGDAGKALIEAVAATTELDATAVADAHSVAAARAGLLAAMDPASGVGALRGHARMFNGRAAPKGIDLPGPGVAALPFVVSGEHLDLRLRLRLGVAS